MSNIEAMSSTKYQQMHSVLYQTLYVCIMVKSGASLAYKDGLTDINQCNTSCYYKS